MPYTLKQCLIFVCARFNYTLAHKEEIHYLHPYLKEF